MTRVGESERRQGLAPCHLSPQKHRAAESPSSPLSNCQTVKLAHCQTIKLSSLKTVQELS